MSTVIPEGGMLRALRSRNYRLFFAGQLISLIGTWMQTVAQSWLVYSLTGSTALLGLVGFCNQIPVFLLAPLGGTVADRFPKRTILLCTQAVSMLLASVLAALTLSSRVQVEHVFVLASLLGVCNAFDIPTRQAFVVEMVGKPDLMNAIALNSSMFNGARLLGPALAGVLVASIGEGWCFLLNALSYIAVLTGLLLMRIPAMTVTRKHGSPIADILEGFRFVATTRPIRSLLLLLGGMSLLGMPYTVLMPVFAAKILHGNAYELGWLMSSAGLGALIGALMLARRSRLKGLGNWVFRAALGFSLGLIAFSFSRSLPLSMALLVVVGLCTMLQMASCNTLIQSLCPDLLRGRVMAVYAMMLMGMAPIGAVLAGFLAGHIGAPATVAIGGVASLITALLFGLHLPQFRVAAHEMLVGMAAATQTLAQNEAQSPDVR